MKARTHGHLVLALIAAVWAGTSSPAWAQAPSAAELQKLVAPIALYPDPLVAQILPASTQPIQIVEAARAVAGGERPSEDAARQWDPSVQALLSFPTVLKMMNDKINWTTQLGEAVAANQGAVMAAIQSVRQQAHAAGNLKSSSQQTVETKGTTIIIEPANPQYIYVPQYNPVAILQPAPYYAYAPLMTFGLGFAAGAATAYACDWGHYGGYGSVTVNNSYHYSYNNNYNAYHSGSSGSYSAYHPQSGVHTGYNANTGTYGAYNPKTGKYGTYNPSTGAYNKDGSTGTWNPSHNSGSSSGNMGATHSSESGRYGGSGGEYGGSHWGSGGGSGGDAFHGMGGGGWGAQSASNRGWDSGGDRGGGGWGGGDRGGGGFGGFGGGDRGGGGFGGFRGGGFRGRR